MRVAHLACVAPPEIGGIGRVAADEVSHLRTQGVEAILFAPQGPDAVIDPSIRPLASRWRFGNAAAIPLAPILAWKPDVLHLHYPFYGTAEPLLWSQPTLPVVVTFHMDATPSGWKGIVTRIHQRILQPRLLTHAARILVSSYDYAEQSSLATLLPVFTDRVRELPFAVDTEIFCPIPTQQRAVPELLFVGGMDEAHHFKGIPQLLRALSQIKDVAWHLTLVGDGALRASYEELAQQVGIATRLHFRGRISASELVAFYQGADLLLFPSTTAAEAFGLVALEAQSCGVPVIASDLPGVRTVVRHEETGLLVPPGDEGALRRAITRLLKEEALRHALGVAARKRVEATYAWPVHVEALKKIYQDVCVSPS